MKDINVIPELLVLADARFLYLVWMNGCVETELSRIIKVSVSGSFQLGNRFVEYFPSFFSLLFFVSIICEIFANLVFSALSCDLICGSLICGSIRFPTCCDIHCFR